MSLSLAQTWVRTTVRHPQARADGLRFLERAAAGNVPGTLIVGPHLSSNRRGYLGRWDGRELLVVELNQQQQRDWQIQPQALIQHLESQPMSLPVQRTEPRAALTLTDLDPMETFDGNSPWSGSCTVEVDASHGPVVRNAALKATYFRPDLPRQVTAMSYVDQLLVAPGGPIRFRFPALFSPTNPQTCRGALVVFLQLFTAEDWTEQRGCCCISNVAHVALSLR